MKDYENGQEKKALELARSPCFMLTSYLNRLFEPYERECPKLSIYIFCKGTKVTHYDFIWSFPSEEIYTMYTKKTFALGKKRLTTIWKDI